AAELHPEPDRTADRLDRRAVDRAAGEGAVEIDDMQPRKTERGKRPRLRGGIVVEHRRARHVAAQQPHAGAALQVYCRIEDHEATCAHPPGPPPAIQVIASE